MIQEKELYGMTLSFPDELLCIDEGKWITDRMVRSESQKPYRWIHYDSQTLCSTCLLKQYFLWDELIDYLGSEDVEYLFLLEPGPEFSKEDLIYALSDNYFSQPVFIDTYGGFVKKNDIRLKSGSFDLLADQSGTVILVGDLRNDNRLVKRVCKIIDNH